MIFLLGRLDGGNFLHPSETLNDYTLIRLFVKLLLLVYIDGATCHETSVANGNVGSLGSSLLLQTILAKGLL